MGTALRLTDVPLLKEEVTGKEDDTILSTSTVPPPLGSTSTVSSKLAPCQPAATGFAVNNATAISANTSAEKNHGMEILIGFFFMSFSIPGITIYNWQTLLLNRGCLFTALESDDLGKSL